MQRKTSIALIGMGLFVLQPAPADSETRTDEPSDRLPGPAVPAAGEWFPVSGTYGGPDSSVLYCQNEVKTTPIMACIPPGAFQSEVQPPGDSAGTNINMSVGAMGADEFTVPSGETWLVDQVCCYLYCGNTGYASSPFASGALTIFDGDPSTGGTTMCDSPYTNYTATHADDIYRTFSGQCATDRPLWWVCFEVDPPCELQGGQTYWVGFQMDNVAGSGPWICYRTITGRPSAVSGLPAYQLWQGTWQVMGATTTGGPQDMPFCINGTGGGPKPCPGDFNCDGKRDFDDIDAFVAALGSGQCQCPNFANCDPNGDGQITFDDIDPFVALLGVPCPELCPQFTSVPTSPVTTRECGTISFDIIASSTFPAPIVLSMSSVPSLPPGVFTPPTPANPVHGTFLWNTQPGDAGNYAVTFYADNGVCQVSTPVTIDVRRNKPPTFVSPPTTATAYAGEAIDLVLEATDPEGDMVSMSLSPVGLPPSVTFNATSGTTATGTVHWVTSPPEVGSYDLVFTASDGCRETDTTVVVEVRPRIDKPSSLDDPLAVPCAGCRRCEEADLAASLTDPVRLFSGEFDLSETDLRVPGRGLDFIWARRYRSRAGPSTQLGHGWDYSYNIRIERSGPDFVLHDGNGRADVYQKQPEDKWTRDESFRVLSPDEPGNPNSPFTMTFADTGTWHFLPLDGRPEQGKLSAIVDRNGNTLSFLYDAQGRLSQIVDTLDRVHTVVYYPGQNLIHYLEDFAGRRVTYQYYESGQPGGLPGDLKSVRSPAVRWTSTGNNFPNGKTRTYTYSTTGPEELRHNLLTIVDGRRNDPNDPTYDPNRPYLVNEYHPTQDPHNINYDRIVRQTWGDPGDIIDMVYAQVDPNPGNNNAVIEVIVNDRVGSVREFFYDEFNRAVMTLEYTGRADPDQPTTQTLNRPTGKLRSGDPDFFETRYGNNADGLRTRVLHPRQSEIISTYDSNGPQLSRGNLLRREWHPGPAGGSPSSIVQTWEYAAGGGCCGSSFVECHVDGRGNVIEHDYDASFNRIETRHRIAGIVENWEHNKFGQVTAHILPCNAAGSGHRRRDEYRYHDSGHMRGYLQAEIVDAGGFDLTTTYEYNFYGILARVVDPRGNATDYEPNQLDQVVREHSRPVSGVRYQRDYYYDANNNVFKVEVQNIDEKGSVQPNSHFTTTYEFKILDYRVRETREVDSGHDIVTEYEYDANRNRTLVRYGEATNGSQPTNTLTTLYDERDLVFQEILAAGDPAESVTQYDYDDNRGLTRRVQGVGAAEPRERLYVYDGYDRLVETTDPMGNVTSYEYDANHNPTLEHIEGEFDDQPGSTGNVRLGETRYVYDAMDRLIRTEVEFFDPSQTPLPGGQHMGKSIRETVWSDNSQVVRTIDDRLNATDTTYDRANRVDTVTDARGNTISYERNPNSNITRTTQTDKSDLPGASDETFITTYAYDELDRLIQRVSGVGVVNNTVTYGYDSRDNRTVMTDALGNETRYEYDGVNRLLLTVRDMNGNGASAGDPEDVVTTQTWDDTSRLTSQGDDNGNVTAYEYDALNRRTREDFADPTSKAYRYDVHHNRTHQTDANGTEVESKYDLNNRVKRKDVAKFGPGVSPDTTFEEFHYDGRSRLVLARDDDSEVTHSHDSLSNVLRETLNGQPTTCTYDGTSNETSCTYPGGRAITRTFDALNRTQTISDGAGPIATYQYVGPGRVARGEYANGTRSDYAYDGITGTPNPPGDFGVQQIVGTTHSLIAGGALIDQRSYSWDRVQNKTRRRDLRAGGPQLTHDYEYDAAYRLVRSTASGPGLPAIKQDYTLDGVGNRETVTGGINPGSYTMDRTLPEPADFQMNQYTTTSFDGRLYDKNGNLVIIDKGPSTQRVVLYDYRNRMVQFTDAAPVTTKYAYDALGRRIKKVVDTAGTPQTTRYFYHGWQVVEERGATDAILATYIYGLYIDEVLNMQGSIGVSPVGNFFYHTDDLYNVMALTDAAGNVVERYEYDDYGQPLDPATLAPISGNPSPLGNPYLFTGRRYDPETAWYHYRTRYLDARAGRFTIRDTIGIWGDATNTGNGYTYARSNAWSGVDPLGLCVPMLSAGEDQSIGDSIHVAYKLGLNVNYYTTVSDTELRMQLFAVGWHKSRTVQLEANVDLTLKIQCGYDSDKDQCIAQGSEVGKASNVSRYNLLHSYIEVRHQRVAGHDNMYEASVAMVSGFKAGPPVTVTLGKEPLKISTTLQAPGAEINYSMGSYMWKCVKCDDPKEAHKPEKPDQIPSGDPPRDVPSGGEGCPEGDPSGAGSLPPIPW